MIWDQTGIIVTKEKNMVGLNAVLLKEQGENESLLSQGRAQGVSVQPLSDEMTFGKKHWVRHILRFIRFVDVQKSIP